MKGPGLWGPYFGGRWVLYVVATAWGVRSLARPQFLMVDKDDEAMAHCRRNTCPPLVLARVILAAHWCYIVSISRGRKDQRHDGVSSGVNCVKCEVQLHTCSWKLR